jgi:hypothetical protein
LIETLDGWAVRFWIGVQGFTLDITQPRTKEEAKWYEKNVITALNNLVEGTEVSEPTEKDYFRSNAANQKVGVDEKKEPETTEQLCQKQWQDKVSKYPAPSLENEADWYADQHYGGTRDSDYVCQVARWSYLRGHRTAESKVGGVSEEEPTQDVINFAVWYSGMERSKVLRAYERYKKETYKN